MEEEILDEQQKDSLDYVKQGAKFILDGGKFDSVLVVCSKREDDQYGRYSWVEGNYYAAVKIAELYVRDQINKEE